MPSQTDLSSIWGPTPSQTVTPPSSNPSDLSSIWGQPKSAATSVAQNPTPTQGLGGIWGSSQSDQPKDESDRFTQEDPNSNWLEKAWGFANKPLTESLFGWGQYRSGAGGVERFAEKTLSGLTSPLSVLMTAAFLPAGIAEGVAGGALKEGLTEGGTLLGETALDGFQAAGKVENYAKAVNAAQKAKVTGQTIQSAVSAATNGEMPYQEFLNYGKYLRNQGLRETDMLGESFARRGISVGLSKAGVPADKALWVAKGAETLVNAGFGVQAVHGAMYAYPRALDQLQNGDYDGAAESILTAGADTVFGALGLAHSMHSVQDLVPGVNEKNNLALSDEIENFKRIFHTPEGQIADTQFRIEALRKTHMAEMFEVAGLPEYADKFRNIPEGEKFRWDKEFVNALNNLVVNKTKREALADKQMQFFAALDSGNKASLASQKISGLVHAYKLEEWAKFQNLPIAVREQRGIQNIATEEANNSLLSKENLTQANNKIRDYDLQLSVLQDDLKQAKTPDEAQAIRTQMDRIQDQQNAEQLNLPQLRDEAARNARWEAPAKRFEAYENWINRLKSDIEKHPDDPALAVKNQNRIQALKDRVAREFEPLFQEKYDHLNRQLNEAAKDINPTGPGDRNALDEFNQKLRIMGVNPQDMAILEDAFPQFRLPKVSPSLEDAFYYKSAQVVRDKIQGPQPGSAVLKTLQNNGVKPEELYWTGLDKFLDENKDNKLTPQQIQDHINSHQLNLEEVPLGYDSPRFDDLRDKSQRTPEEEEEFRKLRDEILKHPNEGPPKYTRYTYPGGENQREFIITAPMIGIENGSGYESSHWPNVANPIAHVRTNDRVLPDGRKLLHIEELQSDWHQEGRQHGYGNGLDEEGLFRKGVPNAPFKKTWPELLVKRMVHYAAEHGYDGVSWTPGEEQVNRYPTLADLADEVIYDPKKQNLFTLKNGHESRSFQNVPPEKIAQYIGKEPARRLMESRVGEGESLLHRISGEKLKVGGEGMRGFYDKIVPDIFTTIGKKFGTKIDKTTIGDVPTWTPEEQKVIDKYEELSEKRRQMIDDIHKAQYDDRTRGSAQQIADMKTEYNRLIERREDFYDSNYDTIDKYHKSNENKPLDVNYLPLNEKLKDSVLQEGFPLFNREFPPKPTEEDKQMVADRLQKTNKKLDDLYEKQSELYQKEPPTKPDYREAERIALEWAETQRKLRGDRFATEEEMKFGRSDPIGSWGDHDLLDQKINQYLADNGFEHWRWGRGGFTYDHGLTPESKALDTKIQKLDMERQRLEYVQGHNLPNNYIGQVHKLADGTRILYVPSDVMLKIQSQVPKVSRINAYKGMHVPAETVQWILRKLESKPNPNVQLMDLINKSLNKEGDLVVSQTPTSHGGNIEKRLSTLREENIHRWQGAFSRTVAQNHLTSDAYDTLYKVLPKGIQKYLTDHRYTGKDTRVLEAAAKMMANRNLSTLGVNPEEAASFLHQYFTAIRKQHGDNAFDNLTHTTQFARKLKEDFINEYRHPEPREPVPGPEPTERPVEGVGAGGGGGPAEPPQGEPPKPGDWREKFGTSGFPIEPWQTGPQDPALPDNLTELINKARDRNHSEDQLNYVQRYIKALAYVAGNKMTPREIELYKALRKADDDNWTVGYNSGIINSIVDNHIHHIWGEDKKRGYPVVQHAGSGAFAINASQARHRSWGTAFEGILQGRKLAVHDPVNIIAHDANNIATAAGHRQILDLLQKSGLRSSDGTPLGVFMGRGTEVPGEDGSPSSVLVNPNVVRNILLNEREIERLQSANLLDTYIKDGRIVDRTQQVNQGNVKEWIQNTKDKLDKLIQKNPLLANPKDRIRHEAGWGQLQNFAQEQAGKISAYLNRVLPEVKNNLQNGRYGTADPAQKPEDFSMAESYGDLLHGQKRNFLTPQEVQRFEEYQKRNENYTQGLNGRGTGPMTPGDVARLLMQEKKHLDPELTSYLDEHHDLFSRDAKGNVRRNNGEWTKQGLNTAAYHIAHAALNKDYPQLIQDQADLKYVDDNLTSANPITQEMHKQEALKRLEDINARQPKEYLWAPKGYITIDHPAFRGWKWMANVNGKSVLAQSDFAVHPEVYDYLVNRLGLERSKLREDKGLGKITGPLLSATGKAKSVILSGSPFHVIQEGLRAFMLGVNPFVRPNPVEHLDEEFQTPKGPKKLLRLGVENGLTLFNNRLMAEDAAVGVASHFVNEDSLVRKIPILSPALINPYIRVADQVHDLLFSRLIPSYKASGFRKMFNKYMDAHPDWSDDAVAHAAAEHTNNAFGGINWREMGRSATTQDWFHLLALAPDWLESEMRFAAGLFKGVGIGPSKYEPESGKTNITQQQVAYMAIVLWSSARVLNLLYSGNAHYETPFGLATKDKDGREIEFSVRTMPTDILHMASDPMGFINGRMSPLLRTEEEVRTGRNQYGQKLTPGEKYVDMVSNMFPIWGQSGLKAITHLSTAADVPGYAQVAKGLGATSNVYRTPAQKTAANLAAERSEEGSMTPSKIQHHRLLLQIEDDLRTGRIKNSDLQMMVDQGGLPVSDAKAAMKNVQETAGEDPETARLYSRVSRLDFAGADAVYKEANPQEKAILHKLIVKKANSYIKKSLTDETPITRLNDPLFKIARRYAPLGETVSQ